jgi:hypothetical protein
MMKFIRAAAGPLALLLASACSDRAGVLAPATGPAPATPVAALACRATVATRTVTCAAPAPAGGASRDLILGGQGVYLQLSSSNVAYDSVNEVLSADVTLQNLLGQPIGTTDGTSPAGIRIFFHDGPVTTSGSGEVTVANADGFDAFTGSVQPYFSYPDVLQPYERTAARSWQFNVPPSVGSFEFQLYVNAPLPNEPGVLKFTRIRGGFTTRMLSTGWAAGLHDLWLGGDRTLMYWNGQRFAVIPLNTNSSVYAIHGTSPADVWAVGSQLVEHFDGRRWSAVDPGAIDNWGAVYAAGASDVWLAGSAFGKILHWTGGGWSVLDPGSASAVHRYWGAWGSGPSDFYLVGGQWNATRGAFDGIIRHWTGTAWRDTVFTGSGLAAVWGSSANDVWAVGSAGLVAHWDGTGWTTQSLTAQPLGSVWGTAPNDVYVAGGSGATAVAMHWDGATWTQLSTGATTALRLVTGLSAGQVLMAGDNGTVRIGSGSGWNAASVPLPEQFNSLWVAGENDLYATHCDLGGGTGVLHSTDGVTWTDASPPNPSGCLSHVWGAAGQVFAVGGSVIEHFDGAAWSETSFGVRISLNSVWGSAADNVYAVGWESGDLGLQTVVILHWDGTSWTRLPEQREGQIEGIWGSGPNDIYTVGTAVLHWDGTQWEAMGGALWSQDHIRAVWGTDADHVFIAGARLYTGSRNTWSSFAPVQNYIGYDLWGSGPDDVYAVGTQTLHWNGSAWSFVNTDAATTLRAAGGLSRRQLWMVGDNGIVLRGQR